MSCDVDDAWLILNIKMYISFDDKSLTVFITVPTKLFHVIAHDEF